MIPRYKISSALTEDNEALAVVTFQIEFELAIGPDLVDAMVNQVTESVQGGVNKMPTKDKDLSFVNELMGAIADASRLMSTLRANALQLGGQALEDYKNLVRSFGQDWVSASTDVSFEAITAMHKACTQFQAVRAEVDTQNFCAYVTYSAGLTQYRERVTAENVDAHIARLEADQERLLKMDPTLLAPKPTPPGKWGTIISGLAVGIEVFKILRDDALPYLKMKYEEWQKEKAAAAAQAEKEAADKKYREAREAVQAKAEAGGYYREKRGADLYIQ